MKIAMAFFLKIAKIIFVLVRKEIIRKLVDQYYQVAHYLVEDQLQAMQLIIDIATAVSEEDESFLYKIDNSYFERQFLLRLIALANKRGEHTRGKKFVNNQVRKNASIYLFEIRGESVNSIAMTLEITEQEVMTYLECTQVTMAKRIGSENGRPLN